MELQLGLALPNAANDHDGSSEGRGIDLDLNMGIGGGGNHGRSANRVPRRQPQQKHDHQLLRWSTEDEMDDIDRGKHESSPMRTLPLFHWSNVNDDTYMDSSSYHQPSKATSSSVNSTYVKVTMEGIGIGRKVDLSLHHSFIDLKHTLLLMFGIYNEDSDSYQLAYQDRGGQWVVAHDSSWRDFIRSTQRLKILKI